jgi:heterodisulfide reductase subunit C/quinone-modifying oxidoreductase subunit QmoC
MESHTFPPDVQVDTLSRAFIRNIYKYGRNYELGLGISYYLRTSIGRAFANALMPFKMVPRKRLGIFPRRIKNIKQMRAIIDRANQFGEGS